MMPIEIQNLDEKWFEHRLFPKGYGQFPYLIIKTDFKAFIQIPIHINGDPNDIINYPGVHLKIEINNKDFNENGEEFGLHDALIDVAKSIKNQIESKRKEPCEICLVETKDKAFYFQEDTISLNTSIPYGGTLTTLENKIIASNVEHYLN
ncbi:hypothetical protein [Flavobacterium sp.]|uniref:hypothetical protein n=1 Tax=Flavobacterium sp. TaxID=239 RepID=UPI002618D8F9|nr:hypothetical protein [Flavobacterium sp.]